MQDKTDPMIGRTFGLWTVIAQAESDKYGRKHYICRCSCGKERRVAADNLRSGKSSSCGHTRFDERREDISGRRFGRLTPIRHTGRRGGNPIWLCRCDCGAECEVAANNLKNGHTTSCGCRKEEIYADIDTRVSAQASSPLAGKFETNVHAKCFCLENNGHTWHIRNMMHFVREHRNMFGLADDSDYALMRVAKGLYDAGRRGGTWYGWRVTKED